MVEKKVLKIGVMGAQMGGAHTRSMKALGDRAVITAICEKNPEIYNRVDGWVRPETKFYTDFDEFIHSGIDAVILANYFHEHAKYAIKAFEAGVDVLSETTAAPSLAECVQLVEAYEKYGRKYSLAVNCSYFDSVYNMRNKIRSGEAGKVLYAEAEYYHSADKHAVGAFNSDINNLHWRQTLPGSYYNMHTLGALMYATDSMPKTVWCKSIHVPGAYILPTKLTDSPGAVVITEMDNGAVFKTTGCSSIKPTSKWYRINCENFCMESERYDESEKKYIQAKGHGDVEITIPGSVNVGLDTPDIQAIKAKFDEQIEHGGVSHGGIDLYNKVHFINYLNGEEESEFDIYKAVTLSAVGILGWYSVLTGKEFRIPDFRNPEDRDKIRWDTRMPFAKKYEELTLPCKLEERDKFDLYDQKYKFGL
ncbi:MAG: Gfo/Idh/MocA family oxidoreductase [Lachnospiraceae bacterium]|nr:Gfo/Idh/MocA family oxidoreductase [Lachnospiraceae bacterium]